MTPVKKRIVKLTAILGVAGLVIGTGIVIYLFNMPHRDVQKSDTDFSLTTSQLVNEYLSDKEKANNKYLAKDGDSKILEVKGTIFSVSEDYEGRTVILLKEGSDKAGVNCFILAGTNINKETLKAGKSITVKGVIRSGAAYDEDLGLYENVILEKCSIIK